MFLSSLNVSLYFVSGQLRLTETLGKHWDSRQTLRLSTKQNSLFPSGAHITVKSGVLFPPILQRWRQYCNVHALIVPSKLHLNLQVATVSISTNLWISILSWQIFADKNTAKQLILFGSILSAKICQENIEINKFVEIDIVATCKFRCNLLGAISALILQY